MVTLCRIYSIDGLTTSLSSVFWKTTNNLYLGIFPHFFLEIFQWFWSNFHYALKFFLICKIQQNLEFYNLPEELTIKLTSHPSIKIHILTFYSQHNIILFCINLHINTLFIINFVQKQPQISFGTLTQPAITCLKLTTETLGQAVKYV